MQRTGDEFLAQEPPFRRGEATAERVGEGARHHGWRALYLIATQLEGSKTCTVPTRQACIACLVYLAGGVRRLDDLFDHMRKVKYLLFGDKSR
jgi:hypothetical protein